VTARPEHRDSQDVPACRKHMRPTPRTVTDDPKRAAFIDRLVIERHIFAGAPHARDIEQIREERCH
jgi:hypothetical protein